MKSHTILMGDVIDINNNKYFVAEINTKGNREILELDIVKPTEGQTLTIEITHNSKTGDLVAEPILSKIPVFYCKTKQCWKL